MITGDWYQHGIRIDSIPVDDRAVQYGDGVFETIAVRDASPRCWSLHMTRLQLACDRLGLTMPVRNILRRDLDNALARTAVNTAFCAAKLVISAGGTERGYHRPKHVRSISRIGIFPATTLHDDAYRLGVVTRRCQTILASQPRLAGIKSLNRLDQVIARNEWSAPNIFDGLMCDDDENLICGTRTNLFVVREDHIETPSLHRCGVSGIMRQRIIELLAKSNIAVTEMAIGSEEFGSFDEVFLSNSQIGVVPVRQCDEHNWSPGEATRSVMALLAYNGVPECRP